MIFTFYIEVRLVLPVVINFVPVSKEGYVEQHVPTKIAAPGEAFRTMWQDEQMAHAASVRNASMSLVFTVLAMSSSAVGNIVIMI